MAIQEIRKVTIVGSGTMGTRIGLACALNGYDVTLYDVKNEILEKSKITTDKLLKYLLGKSRITSEQADKAKNKMIFTMDIKKATDNTDLISESVIEDINIKKSVWKELAEVSPEKTIFTTNTSSLLPSSYAKETNREEKFCGMHFHDVFDANVMDIMPNPKTEKWVVDTLYEFGKSIQQIPIIMKKEFSGYVFNTMLMAWLGAAGYLISNDIASVRDIDRSWMGNFKVDRGPLGLMDSIGLDTVWHVVKAKPDRNHQKFADFLYDNYVSKGKLGVKTGEGFYKYPNPEYEKEDFINS